MQLLTKFGKLKPLIKYKEDSRHFILTTFPETSISASDATEDGHLTGHQGHSRQELYNSVSFCMENVVDFLICYDITRQII